MIWCARRGGSGACRRAQNDCRGDTLRFYRLVPTGLLGAGCAALLVCGVAAGQGTPKSSSATGKQPVARVRKASAQARSQRKPRRRARARKHGQQKIDSERAHEIQAALIREHYLEGPASGTWDAKSQAAMERYQADNGWQSKTVPDSRALIKLGLGPDHEHLLNPESAMTSRQPLHPAVSNSSPATDPAPTTPPQK
jgi:putative peptidoglycan binding protein